MIQSLPLMLLEIIGEGICLRLATWRYGSSLPVEMAGAYSKLQLDPQETRIARARLSIPAFHQIR